MKKLIAMIMFVLMSIGMVSAVGDTLDPLDITMAQNETRYVEYCVNGIVPANGTVTIIVDPVCEDQDGISGCSASDDATQTEFTATPVSNITTVNGAGCTDIELKTSATANGLFYYTVNGQKGEAQVTSETGSVFVPEFGILATLAVLGLAGVYISRKRE